MIDVKTIDRAERLIFGHRIQVIVVFSLVTLVMGWFATQLRIDAGFTKLLPLQHPYMQTFLKYQDEFGGADRILIALMVKDGDIFNADFFHTLKSATDEVFFLPGVDRSRVKSLFTPNVRFTEVVVEGIVGGNVVPADFIPTEEGLAEVRENILKAEIVGRLVANDFSGAIISAELLEFDPATGERLDYVKVASTLEDKVRDRFATDKIDVHIIGFAKAVGDIRDGAVQVVTFFLLAFLITAILFFLYANRLRIVFLALLCSSMAVVWQLGMLPILGFGLDPMSILVPFLVFAIGVSHGVQMVSAIRSEVYHGADFERASRLAFRKVLLPGTVALTSDTVGFITILFIAIGIIREMAITASIGVGVIIFTNLVLLPVLMSYVKEADSYREKLKVRADRLAGLWQSLSTVTQAGRSMIIVSIAVALALLGVAKAKDVEIGDLHRGVPELRADSRYNLDSKAITQSFSIGVDVMTVFAQTKAEGCIDYDVMNAIDQFAWHMANVEGVGSVLTLASVAKVINAGWNEGNLKWRVLPRSQTALVQATSPIDTSSGLLNEDCSVMPVVLFATDHKATTIQNIVEEVKLYSNQHGRKDLRFMLAGSNVGVMAATNETVQAAQFPILLYVFTAVVILCGISFRSIGGTLIIVLPLALVSLLTYALMSYLQIGLKVNTLPVVALGVGIGVDYGIYIFSRLQNLLRQGYGLTKAYETTLAVSGVGVICTGGALAAGVATWIFSPLQFQADMGILLIFMFLMNMLGAILLLPALAFWLLRTAHIAPRAQYTG